MNTAVITAGIGPHARWAKRLAERFRYLNPDLTPVRVVTDRDVRRLGLGLASPMLVKAFLWDLVPADADRLVWIDADCLPVAPLGEIPECWQFAAREDFGGTRELAARSIPLAAKVGFYFNSGVFVCRRDARLVLDSLKGFASRVPVDRFGEQTYLNLAVARQLGIPEELPRTWNWRPDRDGPPPPDAKLLHVAGGNLTHLARAWLRLDTERAVRT